jgi:SAM-dependent methyltransferase
MSGPSAVHLTRAFADDAGVSVVHDGEGRWPFETDRRFDLIVAISVLHHIPDYEAAVRQYVELTRPGGAFVSWQDPMWYPRVGRAERWLGRASYLIWRLGQGHYLQGLATRARRLRGILDEHQVSDMSEYHVVRQGVDELALQAVLERSFDDVRVVRYWSTQAGPLHRLGAALGLGGTFALIARDRLPRGGRAAKPLLPGN